MKLISMLFSGLLLAFASAASAQNYYVCDNGDDNNDGRSEATPFQTYEKAMDTFNRMFAGESVLFCRGGVFPAEKFNRIFNRNCGPEKPCTIADYGDESKPAPMIVARGITALNFQNPGNARPDGGYHIKNLTLISKSQSHSGIMLFNDVNDVIIDNLHIEGFNAGVFSAGSNAPEAGSNQANDRIVLRNSSIVNNSSQGWMGGCNDCLIEKNHFENNGFKGPTFHHSIYINSPVRSQNFSSRNITVRNNTIKNSTRVNGLCQGTSFVVHGLIENLTIDGNVLQEEKGKVAPSCWGIAIDPGTDLDESFVGLRITNNKLFNLGGLGIGCSSCKDVLIADNIIIDEVDLLRTGIQVPNKPENSLKSENVTIKNNKIINNHTMGVGILLGGENKFIAFGNEISLSSTDSRAECIRRQDANSDTDISKNSCNSHISVKIIDEPAPYTDVAKEEVAEKIVEQQATADRQPTNEEVASSESATQEDETSFIRPITSSSTTTETETTTSTTTASETTASSGTSGGGSGGDTSSSRGTNDIASSDGDTTLADEGYTGSFTYSNTSADVTVETVDSGSTTTISGNTGGTSRPSTVSPQRGNSSIRTVTIDEVKDVTNNDISDVDENQCRVFARGRCMMM